MTSRTTTPDSVPRYLVQIWENPGRPSEALGGADSAISSEKSSSGWFSIRSQARRLGRQTGEAALDVCFREWERQQTVRTNTIMISVRRRHSRDGRKASATFGLIIRRQARHSQQHLFTGANAEVSCSFRTNLTSICHQPLLPILLALINEIQST